MLRVDRVKQPLVYLEMAMARKSITNVNFCELFPRELFGTFIGRFYLCTLFVLFEDIRIQFNYPYVQ